MVSGFFYFRRGQDRTSPVMPSRFERESNSSICSLGLEQVQISLSRPKLSPVSEGGFLALRQASWWLFGIQFDIDTERADF